MGGAIARNLVDRGFAVQGFDIDPARCDQSARDGVQVVESATAMARTAEVIVLSLPSGDALAAVASAIAAAAGPAVVLECSTLGLDAKEEARAVLAGSTLLDAAAEALALAEKLGLDPGEVHAALEGSPASSAMFDLRGRLMVEGAFEPAQMRLAMWQKDLHLIAALAADAGAATPLLDTASSLFERAIVARPEADTAAVLEVLRALQR